MQTKRVPSKTRVNLPKKHWEVIKAKALQGVPYATLARDFGVAVGTIKDKAIRQQWPTPLRVSKRKLQIQRAGESLQVPTDDPAKALAQLWLQREAEAREQTYKQTSNAIDRFFAMNPVPQDFREVEIAVRLRDKAIKPDDEAKANSSVNIAFLTSGGSGIHALAQPIDV